jgi:dienelactone hydrolase
MTICRHASSALWLSSCILLAALVVSVVGIPARGQNAVGQVMLPSGGQPVPGVIILDSNADVPASRAGAMARRLVQAGFATLIVQRDPLAGAAVLRRQSEKRIRPARTRCQASLGWESTSAWLRELPSV